MSFKWKRPEEMTLDEVEREVESLESYFKECEEIGQGVNTKETVRHRACLLRVALLRSLP